MRTVRGDRSGERCLPGPRFPIVIFSEEETNGVVVPGRGGHALTDWRRVLGHCVGRRPRRSDDLTPDVYGAAEGAPRQRTGVRAVFVNGWSFDTADNGCYD